MSIGIPNPWTLNLGGGTRIDLDGGVDLSVSGLPTDYTMRLRELAPLNINLAPIEVKPVDVSLRLKEIPSIRAHLPVDYRVGLSLFGAELLCVRLCGQAQVITEPYVPNPCEARGSTLRNNVDGAQTIELHPLDRG